jgi:hypothetical protein
MVSFTTMNHLSELAFQEFMKRGMEAEKDKAVVERRHHLMFLMKKKLAVQLLVKYMNSSKRCEENSSSFIA